MWPFTRKHVNGDRAAKSRRARRCPLEQLESRTLFALDLLGALSFGSNTGSNQAFGSVTDNVGNSYVAGHFSGTADFDQAASYLDARDIATARGTTDAFLAKYGPDDSLIWVRTMGTDAPGRDMAMGLRTDTSGNLVVTGQFFGQAQFGSFLLTGDATASNAFTASVSADGDFLSARNFGAVNSSIATDSVGNFYATKSYALSDGHKFDIIKYDPLGNRVWTKSIVPNPLKYANFSGTGAVTIGNNGEIYVTGQFPGDRRFRSKCQDEIGIEWTWNWFVHSQVRYQWQVRLGRTVRRHFVGRHCQRPEPSAGWNRKSHSQQQLLWKRRCRSNQRNKHRLHFNWLWDVCY